ncbi:Uncharacterised protein [Bordetella pertussis]|nr:Uncharacterised protein [Bordetella pertussis]
MFEHRAQTSRTIHRTLAAALEVRRRQRMRHAIQ